MKLFGSKLKTHYIAALRRRLNRVLIVLTLVAIAFSFIELPDASSEPKSASKFASKSAQLTAPLNSRRTDFNSESIEVPLEVESPKNINTLSATNNTTNKTIDSKNDKVIDINPPTQQTATESKLIRAALKNPPKDAPSNNKNSSVAAKSEVDLGEKTTLLNVTDVEIGTLIKTFSKLTGRNYIVDSAVKGKVTVHLPTAVTVEEALRIFESVLLLKGFTTVPIGENIWKVIIAKDAKQTTIPTIDDNSPKPSDALVTQMIRLKNTTADDMQGLLSQFISKEGFIKSFPGTNSIVLVDSSLNISRLKKLVIELDVPAIDQAITIIPVLYAEAKDLAEKITQILGEDEDKSKAQGAPKNIPNQPGFVRSTSAQPGQDNTSDSGKRSLPIKIIPDERTNSLIVVADEQLTLKVRALAEQLDSKLDRSGGRFWVYRLKHADAEAVADILNNIVSGTETSFSSKSKSGESTGSSFTKSGSSSRSGSQLQNPLTQTRQNQSQRSNTPRSTTAGEEGGKVNLEGEVSIAPDPATNSLIVNASRSDYLKVSEVIDALDVKRRQVLVEATILEVTLTEDEGMGIELQGTAGVEKGGIFGQTNFGGITNLLTNPAALTDLTIAAASTGTLTLPGGITIPSQAALISAVSRHSNVNVLSAPTIVTTDNEEAKIIVGENVPFVTSTSSNTTNLNNTFNQIERQDVGITLRITPQISSGSFVILKTFVEISNVVNGTRGDPNGPTTTIRTTETSVEVKDNQMVVTGGLIQDRADDSTRGVPFIQDIPVVGQYFKRQDSNNVRTNLLVFITPKIIKDQFDAREQTKDYSGKVQNEIIANDLTPARTETLGHENIDNVIEVPSNVQDGRKTSLTNTPFAETTLKEKPTTEYIGDFASSRTEDRSKSMTKSNIHPEKPKESASKEDVLEVTVKPKLPELAHKSSNVSKNINKKSTSQTTLNTYVVLRDISTSRPSIPFQINDKDKTIGVEVLGQLKGAFFKVGERYKYQTATGDAEFVCLGVYTSREEAAIIHPSLTAATWVTLSPAETLKLGKSPWKHG